MALHYEDLITPRLCDADGAGVIMKKKALFVKCVEAHWIEPVINKHSCTLYAVHQVHACVDLIERGYLPGDKDPKKPMLEAARKGAFKPDYLAAA
jgi:hypothetical protein